MITFETSIPGEQIGSQLAQDPEEMAYALNGIANDAPDDFYGEVAGYIHRSDAPNVLKMLRSMTAAIEENTD